LTIFGAVKIGLQGGELHISTALIKREREREIVRVKGGVLLIPLHHLPLWVDFLFVPLSLSLIRDFISFFLCTPRWCDVVGVCAKGERRENAEMGAVDRMGQQMQCPGSSFFVRPRST
jgi:hypothetical protein